MNPSPAVQTKRTNFDGSWEDTCPHCGKKQIEHRSIVGELEGIRYEHRLPCAPELEKMHREQRRVVRAGKIIVLIGWVLVPLAILMLQQFVSVIGWMGFAYGLFRLGIETIKYFGDPDKWIPGHKEKREKKLKERHYIYHCERNPEGFERLKLENFQKEEANPESLDDAKPSS